MLQGHVEIFREARMRCDRVEQARRDAVRVAIKEANPIEIFNLREALEEDGEAVAEAEIFAVESGVLPDQGNFADARGGEIFGFAHDGLEAAAAEFAAQLRNYAEGAGMIAAFVDFDVGGVARSRENARRQVVVEIRRQ